MGTPLLVSSVGGGPELVEDGITGRVLPPRRPELWASAAGGLLRDREGLEHMGARARAVTANFSDELHARDMLNIYEHVLAQPKAAPAAMPSPPLVTIRADRESHGRFRRGDRSDAPLARDPALTTHARSTAAPSAGGRREDPARQPHRRLERR